MTAYKIKWQGYKPLCGSSALNPFVTFLFYVTLWPGIFVASILILFLKEKFILARVAETWYNQIVLPTFQVKNQSSAVHLEA